MESILLFFAVGTWAFWLLILSLSTVYTIATERDTHGVAIFATFIAAGLCWNSLVALGTTIAWPLLLIGIGVYALVGGAWSVFRWFKYCREYIVQNPFNINATNDYSGIKETTISFYKNRLQPSKHKSRLIGWIAYWPWSLVWNIVGDTLTAIYDALVNIYQKTADLVIKKALGNIR